MIIALHLGIELTQRCNLDCRHCFRGESCNINISREILQQNSKVKTFSKGEEPHRRIVVSLKK